MIQKVVTHIFERAGLHIGEDVIVHDDRFYRDVLLNGSVGFGDSYVAGTWNAYSIDSVIFGLLKSGIYSPTLAQIYDFTGSVARKVKNLQDRIGARQVIDKHYDVDSSLFLAFLDPYNQYTCGFFEGTDNLDQAQKNKLELICRKLNLNDGDRLLDIGGGWGGLALYVTERYDVDVSIVTLSEQQAEYARKLCEGKKVNVHVCDYRDISDTFSVRNFDKVTAVGILEHIGHKNYPQFMKVVNHALRQEGLFLLHHLYSPTNRILSNPWVRKHIFPNHELPPHSLIESAAAEYFRQVEGIPFQDLTPHYVKTLLAWNERLNKAVDEGRVKLDADEHRKWNFYFLSCAGALRAEHMRVGQFAYEKK